MPKVNSRAKFGVTLAASLFLAASAVASTSVRAATDFDSSGASGVSSNTPGTISAEAQLDLAEQRLHDSLSAEMLANFNLFIYVDKAEQGPLGQQMYVFEKTDTGDLALLYDWPVSTGRESDEIDAHGQPRSTATPRGFFELDPKRFYVDHSSSQWGEAMPYSMFFSWKPNGRQTGLAIHGTSEQNNEQLGSRASAGCVRLALEDARFLFNLIHTRFRAEVPKLAYLDGGDTQVSSEGLLVHAPDGRLETADGYSVMVLIDDYDGDTRVSSLQ